MLVLKNSKLILQMNECGADVVLVDVHGKQNWRLDESTRLVSRGLKKNDHDPFAAAAAISENSKVCTIGLGQAKKLNETTIESLHRSSSGSVMLRWILEADRLRIFANADKETGIDTLALPGTFRPEGNEKFLTAIPTGQGILHTGKGPSFYKPLWAHGHQSGCNMDMFGQITDHSGLLVIAETTPDSVCHWEKTATGEIRIMWMQQHAMGKLDYRRETVIFPTAANITSICKIYRKYEIEHDRFKTWEEKILERPKLEQLFGAAMIFIGYLQDDKIDYAENLRRLKAMGIDKAVVCPLYFADCLQPGIEAFGWKWIDVRNLVPLLHELNYTASSWLYITDGAIGSDADPYHDLRLDLDGKPAVIWEMEEQKWYAHSVDKRLEWAHKFLDNELTGLDAMHYDCVTNEPLHEDHNPAHPGDNRVDLSGRIELLKAAAKKGMLISSEGFWGRMTPYYDLGNDKFAHILGGEEYCVVPMTMLVYHDSAYNTWWEVDNYNNFKHRSQFGRGHTWRYPFGGGGGRLQAAIDALEGTPPDIFPFGKQYNLTPHDENNIYVYTMNLDDPLVQESIEIAKPVMALNKRVGKLELTEHKLHRPDGAVQETVFGDGTRVIANFSNATLEAPEVGLLPGETWKMLK